MQSSKTDVIMEQRNSPIFDLPIAMYTTDPLGRILEYNHAAILLWGRSPIAGKERWGGAWKIYTPDGSPLRPEDCPMAITIRELRPIDGHRIIIERPDGSRRLVAVHPRPILDSNGKLIAAVNMLVDITKIQESERQLMQREARLKDLTSVLEERMEEASAEVSRKNKDLRDSEAKYHRMIDGVEDYAIILLDRNGIIQNWNKGAEKIKGYKEDEIVGRNFNVFYRQEDRLRKLPERLIDIATWEGSTRHEGWRLRKDGTAFWGSVVITAIHDDLGRILGFSKVTRDLTERKTAEEKMKKYASDLEFQNKELQQFAYAAAHDMKEPLRKVQFYISAVLEAVGEDLPEREKGFLTRSAEAAARMKALIDDLLTYARASITEEQQFVLLDLNALLQEALKARQEDIIRSCAMICADSLPVMQGIPVQIRQLFDNLLSNALKYQQAGRTPLINITCESAYQLPETDLSITNRPYYKITFQDNGIGFEPEHAAKIFDMFQRLHGRENYSGTGIGLAICKRVIQNHKGYIEAIGKPGEGASFIFYLPVCQ